MMARDWLQIGVYVVAVIGLAWPLGRFMATVLGGQAPRGPIARVLRPLERSICALAGVDEHREMNWREYARAFVVFTFGGMLVVYTLQRLQGVMPPNPARLGPVDAYLALNTAASFATNTNWQSCAGEATLSYLVQSLGLVVQQFASAAAGLAVMAAVIRGLARRTTHDLGNFWVDVTRATVHVLVPLALVLAVALVSQGVVQTWGGPVVARTLEGTRQVIARGPVASMVAIKQLGTNGGGFFGANSAHPFENPTPLSNFLEGLAILLLPAACCFCFGEMVGDRRQGWTLLAAMLAIYLGALAVTTATEIGGNPVLARMGVDQARSPLAPGGNMEGKELRNGPVLSAVWATATTAASNGSVNAMHDSFMPLGSIPLLALMQLGEVVFGGVGSGLYGMIVFVIVAVFAAGLMVGRTPEYLGKKIGIYEMKMAVVVVLLPPLLVLAGTALAVVTPAARAAMHNAGPHGFTEVLYAFSSAGNNNGSAFAGLATDTPFYNLALAAAMVLARLWAGVAVLAVAGSLAGKRRAAESAGTLPTHTPLFVAWLVAVVLIVGALAFLPVLAIGPLAEHLTLWAP